MMKYVIKNFNCAFFLFWRGTILKPFFTIILLFNWFFKKVNLSRKLSKLFLHFQNISSLTWWSWWFWATAKTATSSLATAELWPPRASTQSSTTTIVQPLRENRNSSLFRLTFFYWTHVYVTHTVGTRNKRLGNSIKTRNNGIYILTKI